MNYRRMHLQITTPSGIKFSGSIDKVIVPGFLGQMTILSQHESMMTPLKKGDIIYTISPTSSEHLLEQYGNHDRTLHVTGGMCHINQDTIDIITA